MLEQKDINKIYFIGIGGIGMSALARYFKGQGKEVSGYDKTSTTLTRQLENENIPVHYEDDPAKAPKDADLVVYTPAVPKDHKEMLYYQQHSYTILKRSDVLGVITRSSFNICVGGTHGKTTITTMIAHILRHSGYGCNAFLGGIAVNYNSNFWSDKRNVCVVEADEYDRSFLKLSPDIAVITAMDADHLDIYGTAGEVEQAFIDFSGKVKPGGTLISRQGLKREKDLKTERHLTYGLEDRTHDGQAGFLATQVEIRNGSYQFRVESKGWTLNDIVLNMGGLHNVENATAAITVAHQLGLEDDKIRAAVEAFKGVKRRFEYIYRNKGMVYIDDYAHHPEELRALISGAKGLFPDRKCRVIFQPHLFTRTRDFVDGFAESLDLADEVFLLPIYPARELPIEGVTSQMIVDRMEPGKVVVVEKGELLRMLDDKLVYGNDPELLITAGAGDIDTLVGPLRELLEKKYG
jgi:UDP-N-acetylmuramate--alanine ligase